MKIILCHPQENLPPITEPIDIPMDEAPRVLLIGTKVWVMGADLMYNPATCLSVDKQVFFSEQGTTFKLS